MLGQGTTARIKTISFDMIARFKVFKNIFYIIFNVFLKIIINPVWSMKQYSNIKLISGGVLLVEL